MTYNKPELLEIIEAMKRLEKEFDPIVILHIFDWDNHHLWEIQKCHDGMTWTN